MLFGGLELFVGCWCSLLFVVCSLFVGFVAWCFFVGARWWLSAGCWLRCVACSVVFDAYCCIGACCAMLLLTAALIGVFVCWFSSFVTGPMFVVVCVRDSSS